MASVKETVKELRELLSSGNFTQVEEAIARLCGEKAEVFDALLSRWKLSDPPLLGEIFSKAHDDDQPLLEYACMAVVAHAPDDSRFASLRFGVTELMPSFPGGSLAVIVTNRSLEHIARFPNLERLDLDFRPGRTVPGSQSPYDDAGLAQLATLSRLKSLCLAGAIISGAGLAHLEQLVELRSLDLSRSRIKGQSLALVARLPRLRTLNLAGTKIKDADLAPFASCDSLKELNVESTKLTDACLTYLPGLFRLQGAGTAITSDQVKRLLPLLD